MTKEGGPDYVPIPERIAVFDNDGTLWSEQPMYVQMVFALDRVKALAPQHPEWKEKQPFKAALAGDIKTLFAGGEEALIELIVATHSGMTTDEFTQIVKDWLATAKNPKTKRPYTEMVFQPMIELMAYMRANGFKTYIVSGGGVEFMRVFSEQVYGVPPEQVIGSTPTIADLLKPLGYATAQVGKNHLGDRNEFLPTVHGFDEFYGNLYHLNAEEEPEDPDYPKMPAFHEKFGPRGVLRCVALTSDNPAPADPRFGPWGKQKCEDTGPLTRKRMETIEEDLLQTSLDFMDKSVKSGKPFFVWHNTTRMHVWTRLSPEWENKSGYGLYADGMMELDWVVGQLLKKLDDLGIANNTIVVLTSDNGAEKFSWPDGGTEPFRGEKGTTWEGGFRVPCVARWPGVIKPNTIINDIASHEDWTPTFLAAAGVPDVKQQLLTGYKGVDRTFKVHLDAYDMSDLLSGKGPGQRKEIFYFDDSGSLNAFRYGDWKVTFATKGSWWADVAKPRTVPLVINLRQDPFEVTMDAKLFERWYADKLWVMVPAQAIVGQFLITFKEFPQRQKSASANIQQVLDQMKAQTD